MGYVEEQKLKEHRPVMVRYGSLELRSFTGYTALQKRQYGYRSGPLSSKEKGELRVRQTQHYTRANTAEVIDLLEDIQRATSPEPAARRIPEMVNERRYSEIKAPRTKILLSRSSRPAASGPWSLPRDCVGYGTLLVNTNGLFSPPSRKTYEATATRIMRNMRPTKPDFELARFVGELRELPMLANLASLPKKPSDLGRFHLGTQFGVIPTVSDIQKAADAVIESETILTEFARRASTIVRRNRTLTLEKDTLVHSRALPGRVGSSTVVGDVNVRSDLAAHNNAEVGLHISCETVRTRELRVFSDFEYFVGDPHGFSSRISEYVAKAKKLSGSGLSASTVWELTPWTWLSDWFIDIGSLLAYQEDVASDGLVARRSGFLVEDRYDTLGHLSTAMAGNLRYISILRSTQPLVGQRRDQWRWPGGPYSMSANWDLTGFQWAILGALGLTKAPKVPYLRKW